MQTVEIFGTRFTAGQGGEHFAPANENVRFLSETMTPAEAMQIIGRMKDRFRKKFAADFSLRSSPEYRHDWNVVIGMEKCGLWHFYGKR